MGLDTEFWNISWIIGVPWLIGVSLAYVFWRRRQGPPARRRWRGVGRDAPREAANPSPRASIRAVLVCQQGGKSRLAVAFHRENRHLPTIHTLPTPANSLI